MIQNILIPVAAITGINAVIAILLVIAERFFANYGECNVSINDGSKKLSVPGGNSLLSTLNSEKIFLPSACGGRGTCAYCKCRVVEGAGPLLPTEEPLLNDEEISQQIRLACQVKVKQDIAIHIPDELFNIKEFTAKVSLIKDLTHDIKLVRFNLIDPPEINFVSGQYVQLQSQPYEHVKQSVSRAYSISSPSFEKNFIELIIRLVPEGICTTWVHFHLKEGDEVKFVGPMGDFRMHDGDGEFIMVAGGSGMAPMAAILAEMAKERNTRKGTYFFGAVSKRDLFYSDEMQTYQKDLPNFTYVPTLSQAKPEDNWQGQSGLITIPLEDYLTKIDTSTAQAYLCGSPGMINACVNIFKKHGVTDERIFFDPFA